mmetsp:Transcript_19432/g.41548  ORF Transcript_19432/g.41548 Transcript_19432/m.41548 type:complete len:246 (-) Transcript_19432:116-853(-)
MTPFPMEEAGCMSTPRAEEDWDWRRRATNLFPPAPPDTGPAPLARSASFPSPFSSTSPPPLASDPLLASGFHALLAARCKTKLWNPFMNSTASNNVSHAGSLLTMASASSLTASDMVCPISSSLPLKHSNSRSHRNFGQTFSDPPEHDDSLCDTMREITSSKDRAGSTHDDRTRQSDFGREERVDASRRPALERSMERIGSRLTTSTASRRNLRNISSCEDVDNSLLFGGISFDVLLLLFLPLRW